MADQTDILYPVYETPGDDTSDHTGRTIHDEVHHLTATRDMKLARYLGRSIRGERVCVCQARSGE